MLSSGSRARFVDEAWPFVVHNTGFCIRFGWNEKQNCWRPGCRALDDCWEGVRPAIRQKDFLQAACDERHPMQPNV